MPATGPFHSQAKVAELVRLFNAGGWLCQPATFPCLPLEQRQLLDLGALSRPALSTLVMLQLVHTYIATGTTSNIKTT